MQLTHEGGTLFLQGEVTVATVTREHERLLNKLCAQPIDVVDFSGVTQVDSACVAVLLAIKRQLAHNNTWQLSALPPAVTALLGLYELEWLV